LKEAKKNKLSSKTINDLKLELQHAIGALYGLNPSNNPSLRNKNIKGILDTLGGTVPKHSYIQEQLLRKNQFMSGRGTIIPSRGDLKLNEIELPEDMGLKIYEPHISRELAKMGYTQLQIKEMIKNKDPKVMSVLHRLGKEIPVVYNRAPSLWKHNLIGAYPKFVPGHSISLPPMVERALAADYDGDQIAVHVPVTPEGIKDVKEKMLASKQLFTDQGTIPAKDLLMVTDQDAIIGVYKASIPSKKKTTKLNRLNY
jgi:DNA-directed RNA polymerase subunit beta'